MAQSEPVGFDSDSHSLIITFLLSPQIRFTSVGRAFRKKICVAAVYECEMKAIFFQILLVCNFTYRNLIPTLLWPLMVFEKLIIVNSVKTMNKSRITKKTNVFYYTVFTNYPNFATTSCSTQNYLQYKLCSNTAE